MYNNIGNKIKTLAKFICIFIAAIWIIIGFSLILGRGSSPFIRLIGLLTIVIGPLFSWIGSFLLFGYGELINKNTEMNENIKLLVKKIKQEEETEQEQIILKKVLMDEKKETEEDEADFFYDPTGDQSWKEQKNSTKK